MSGTNRRYRIITGVLMAALLLGVGLAVHRHVDPSYRDNCPACQQERNPGCQTPAVTPALLIPAPVALYYLPESNPFRQYRIFCAVEFSPRSPPGCC